MKIKICGICDSKTLQYACEMEVDFVGFIMVNGSPRKISSEFLSYLEDFNFKNTTPVFVFVNPDIGEVKKIIRNIPNSILQFHGDESNHFCKQFNQPFWKTVRVQNAKSFEQINDFPSANAILLEAFSNDSYGGTGKTFAWSLLDKISLEKNFVLAGGINIENIRQAISLHPWCIDVNSGVESSLAIKDKILMGQLLDIFKNG
tara:strand:- start:934 stop:1542 length:609 start_codon:yes stop_codon:yes gene_type:complete